MVTPPRSRPSAGNSRSARIRALLSSGMSASAIAKKVGCSPNLVYVVRSHTKAGTTKTKKQRG